MSQPPNTTREWWERCVGICFYHSSDVCASVYFLCLMASLLWKGMLGRLHLPLMLSSSTRIIGHTCHQSSYKLMSTLIGNLSRVSSINSMIHSPIIQSNSALTIIRGFKNPKTKQKSRRTAVKRFLEAGNGRLKRAHCGKVCIHFIAIQSWSLSSRHIELVTWDEFGRLVWIPKLSWVEQT